MQQAEPLRAAKRFSSPKLISIYLGISLLCLALIGLWACRRLLLAGDSKNALFLGLSASRLFLFVLNALTVGFLAYLGLRCLRQPHALRDVFARPAWQERLKQPGFWAALFLVALILLAISLLALYAPLKQLRLSAYQPLQERLWPDLIWLSLASLWALFSAAVGYRVALRASSSSPVPVQALIAENRRIRFIHFSLIILFLITIFLNLLSFPYAIWGGDTDDYLYMAEKSIFSPEFYAGPRPWTTGLLYKLLGADREIAEFVGEGNIIHDHPNATVGVVAQTLISALCWIALAWLAASMLATPWLRPVTLGIILLIGLHLAVYAWNRILLSESLSISLMVLLIALWLWTVKDWQWHKAFLLCLVSLLWIFTRETNAYLILGMAVLLILCAVGRFKRYNVRTFQRSNVSTLLAIALVYLLLFTASAGISDLRNRWATPLANVIFQRILPDDAARIYFITHGMPAGPAILEMEGEWACSHSCALFKEEQYATFLNWLTRDGRKVYIGYLLSRPLVSLAAPLANLDILTGSELSLPYRPGAIAPIPAWLANIIYFQGLGALLFWSALLLGVLAVVLRLWCSSPTILVVLAILLLAYPHAFLTYHGDAMGLSRHAIQFNVQVRLVFWLLFALVMDLALQKREAVRLSDSLKNTDL